MKKIIISSAALLFIIVAYLFTPPQTPVYANTSCSNMGCLDYSCTGPDDCEEACFFVEEINCTFVAPGDCTSDMCGPSVPSEGN